MALLELVVIITIMGCLNYAKDVLFKKTMTKLFLAKTSERLSAESSNHCWIIDHIAHILFVDCVLLAKVVFPERAQVCW